MILIGKNNIDILEVGHGNGLGASSLTIGRSKVSNLEAIHDLIVLLPYDGKDINDVYVTNDFTLIDNGSIKTDTEFELKSINDFMSIKLDETLTVI